MKPEYKYTVLLALPDYASDQNHETYLAHVEAESPQAAVQPAQFEAVKHIEVNDAEDFLPISIFPGHLDDLVGIWANAMTAPDEQDKCSLHGAEHCPVCWQNDDSPK